MEVKIYRLIFYTTLNYLFTIITHVEGATPTDISRLRHQLLENYDPLQRPVQNNRDTVEVDIHFLDNGGMEFDEQKGVMTLHLLTAMTWEDQHMKWDPMSYGNLTEITFYPTEIWRPDVSLINNYDTSEIDHFANTLMIAMSDSTVWWIPPTKFQVACPTDYRLWPYDKQKCGFQVSSWSHHSGEMDMIVPENYTKLVVEYEWQEHVTRNREWKLLDSIVKRNNLVAYCCPQINYTDLLIGVEIQRRSNSHTAAVTVVGLGISVGNLISFWLNPFSHERIPMTLLLMLLNSMYLQYMYQTIPNNGATVPLTICFFRDSLVMVTFAFTWTVMIRYIAKIKRFTTVPLPNFVETLLNSYVASILCLNHRPETKSQIQRKNAEATDSQLGEGSDAEELVMGNDADSIRSDWEWLARLLDRLAFFGYLITYIIFFIAFL